MKGALHILDRSGHQTLEWDTETTNRDSAKGPLDPAYVEDQFNRLVANNFGFGTKIDPETGEAKNFQLKAGEFDPNAYTKVTISPVPQGG